MKKIIILILVLNALAAGTASAQNSSQGFYIKIYGGYSLFTPGSDIQPAFYGSNNENNVNAAAGGSFTGSRLGAGAGVNYGAGLGLPIGNSWTIGLDVNNLAGQATHFRQNYSVDDEVTTETTSHSVLSLIPNVSYKVFTTSHYFIYTRLGVMTAIDTRANFAFYDYNNSSESSVAEAEIDKLTYGVNLGLQGAVGVQYKLNSRISIFGEFTGNFLTVKPKSQVTHDVNNNDDGSVDIYDYNTTFLKSGSGTANRTVTTTTNGNVTTTTFTGTEAPILEHINNLMLNVGVAFGFK